VRPVLVRKDIDHAVDAQRLARVDARDAALGDARRDDASVNEIACVEFASVFRRTSDFRAPVDAGCGSADIGRHGLLRLIAGLPRDCAVLRAAGPAVSVISERRQRGRALQDAAAADAVHMILFTACDCGRPCAACVSARTMPRRARSILKELCS